MKRWLWAFLVSFSLYGIRNPFRYENSHTKDIASNKPQCVGEGMCGDEQLRFIRTQHGELRLIKEKIPSTLGKAEGLGG